MATFEDITVVDLDLKKTTWSRVHSSMRTLYLQLSREPDLEWIRHFNTERESRVVPTRHGMWIEEGYIIFDCLLPNVERFHLPDFQQSIDYANERSRERVAERREERAQRRAEITEEHATLESLRAKIRNDDEEIPRIDAADDAEADEPMLDAVVELPEASVAQAIPDRAEDIPVANEPSPPTLPVNEKAANDEDDFDLRRNEWRTRFRQALQSRKENDHDDPQ
ncbi:MAG TPA: hypothetical protein VH082_01050 [Rudaea sp.]|jgi:hypothetical protein|nr:hypothetical protein [Rudaea sp.]